MPENLISKYPLNTWVMEMQKWYKPPRLVVSNRITSGSFHRRPFFTTATATLVGEGVVFYFPGTQEGPAKFWQPDGSHYEVGGVLVLDPADLDDLRRSHGLPYLPPYFEFEVFDDLKEVCSTSGEAYDWYLQNVIKKWQEMVAH
ncbi:MAG: hypothetical protein HYW45_01155 [Candidatus Daviesbacteria bacterium]|nr:MAG: hypothetical protein HYW45_01155 [Candidatus Daviesbacteria bacterium]